jgi:hypothetical protein
MRLEFYFVLSSVTRKYDLNNDGWNVCYGSDADMHSVLAYVCFGPIVDIGRSPHSRSAAPLPQRDDQPVEVGGDNQPGLTPRQRQHRAVLVG